MILVYQNSYTRKITPVNQILCMSNLNMSNLKKFFSPNYNSTTWKGQVK